MGDGIKWAAEQREAEEKYKKHSDSGRFDKHYLESDIAKRLSKDEIQLLVTRLIIHQLGGFTKFFEKESYSLSSVFSSMSKTAKLSFIKLQARNLGLEIDSSKRISKLRQQIGKLQEALLPVK